MKVSEVQYPSQRMLLCVGDEQHVADVPKVSGYGATGPVLCEACGAEMLLIDVVTVNPKPTWAALATERDGGRLYTTAKLYPLALMSAMR